MCRTSRLPECRISSTIGVYCVTAIRLSSAILLANGANAFTIASVLALCRRLVAGRCMARFYRIGFRLSQVSSPVPLRLVTPPGSASPVALLPACRLGTIKKSAELRRGNRVVDCSIGAGVQYVIHGLREGINVFAAQRACGWTSVHPLFFHAFSFLIASISFIPTIHESSFPSNSHR